MKFVKRDLGEAAEASSGGGDRGLAKEIVTLAILLALLLTAIYYGVVIVTEGVVSGITPEREVELFGKDFAKATVSPKEVPEELQDKFAMCEDVLAKLSAHDSVPQIDYELIYLDQEQPNAFAFPGGTIGVSKGLLEALDEEIAVAFVLAHELGHFANRDHLRGMGRKLGFGLGVKLLFQGDIGSFSHGTTNLVLAKYSRGQESNADVFGIQCVLDTYGDTTGAEKLFEVLEEKGALPRWAYMFSTHPDNKSRIRRILESKKEEEAQ